MSISRELYQNLINDQQVIITPYNAGDLVNNYYQLHNNGNLRMYETMYAENTTIDTENPPKQTEIAIYYRAWHKMERSLRYLFL